MEFRFNHRNENVYKLLIDICIVRRVVQCGIALIPYFYIAKYGESARPRSHDLIIRRRVQENWQDNPIDNADGSLVYVANIVPDFGRQLGVRTREIEVKELPR